MRTLRGLVAAAVLVAVAAAVAAAPSGAAGAAAPEEPPLTHSHSFALSGGTAVDLRLAAAGPYLDLRPPPFLLAGHAGLRLRYQGFSVAGSSSLDLQSLRPELYYSAGSPLSPSEGVSYTFRLGAMLTWSNPQVAPPGGSFVVAPELGSQMSFRLGRSLFGLSESLSLSGNGAGFETGASYGLDLFVWLRASVQITTSTTIGWNGAASVDLYPYLFATLFLGR